MLTEAKLSHREYIQLHERIRQLEEQVAFYQAVLNALPDPLFLKDEDHRVIFVNEAHCQLVGARAEELLANKGADPTPADEQAIFWERDTLALTTDHPIEIEQYLTDRQGIRHLISRRKVAHRLPNGQKILIGIVRDITQRRELEAQLQHEQVLMRQLFNSIPDLIFYKNMKNEYVGCNRAFEQLVGLSESELRGKGTAEILPHAMNQALEDQDQLVLQEKRTIRAEQSVVYPDGRTVILDTLLTPFSLPTGEPIGLLGISRDITDRKATEEALRRAKDVAESANRTKSHFLSTMTHEFRTPMNGVLGLSKLLLETELSDEQHDLVTAIQSSGDTLLTLINNILDFSKIEASRVELEYRSFDLQLAIEAVFDLVAAQATAKGLTLVYLVNPTLPAAFTHDETRLRQILINLLSNAVKFSEQGEIVVTVEGTPVVSEEGQCQSPIQSTTVWELHFTVQDNGIGIRQERMHRLFHPFSQLDAAISRRYGGTGLGLAISKRLVELMGGTMWVESEIGQGSRFHFTIQAKSSPGHHRSWAAPTPILLGRQALVIEQSSSIQRLLKQQLTAWGINVTIHRDFHLRLLKAKYDVLIMELPGQHNNAGYRNASGTPVETFIQAVRYVVPTLPILFLTPLGGRPNLGQDRLITSVPKPIRTSQLHDALVTTIGGKPQSIRHTTTNYGIDKELARRKPLRILLAEDNVVNQKVVRGIMAAHGYRCDIAADGIDVIDALNRQPYDVIFMDLNMPELNGIAATEVIRSTLPPSRQPYIIALTANTFVEESEHCLAAGMNDFISKPIQMQDFVQAIERMPLNLTSARLTTPPTEISMDYIPEKSPTEPSAPIDLALLTEIAATAGNKRDELLKELITLFLESTPPLLASLNKQIHENDLAAVRKIAHTLRSPASQLGAQPLEELCKELEMLPAADGERQSQELVRLIMLEYQRVEAALRQTLVGGSPDAVEKA